MRGWRMMHRRAPPCGLRQTRVRAARAPLRQPEGRRRAAGGPGRIGGPGPRAPGRAPTLRGFGRRGWIEEHRASYSDPLAKAQAGAMGLNADEFGKTMDSPEVEKLVSMDADIGKRIQLPEVPRIFINGKVMPRWKLPGQFVIERVIEEAAQPEQPGAK